MKYQLDPAEPGIVEVSRLPTIPLLLYCFHSIAFSRGALPFFDLLAEKGVLPPLICAAFPPLAFLGAIIAFYRSKDL